MGGRGIRVFKDYVGCCVVGDMQIRCSGLDGGQGGDLWREVVVFVWVAIEMGWMWL